MLQDRGALSEEEGDSVREYKAVHEENFLQLADGGCVRDRRKETDRKRLLKEGLVTFFSSDVFEEFGLVDDLGSFGDSWEDFHDDSCVPAVSSGVPVVIDVSLSLSLFPALVCLMRSSFLTLIVRV